ncbi:MAG: protein kinase [Bacteroidota bacterium]|nr:protein kinase [Bacteroidota bacterium]
MAKVFTITEGIENMGALKTGGQGSVYKARRVGEIITAVKLLPTPIHSESGSDKNFTSFQNEVQKLKKVNEEPNPNVVKILSSGITDSGSFPFIEMEFIEGPDMEELLKPPHDSVFTIKEVIKVAEQLSNALAHCHRLDVKHGDMKSNNVKFNKATGNYVLIDFGLSAMSDEQRRTSLRHAGAIEFMAPEQAAGQLIFQTDVYGFGVILFELLAGQVPFPLRDSSESARNQIMLAHMETPPPDIKALRENNLPARWTEDKKRKEAAIPEWLLSTIYRCLRKKPEERFANGIELHNFIVTNSVGAHRSDFSYISSDGWQAQAEKLLNEKQRLQQLLAEKESELQQIKRGQINGPERVPGQDDYPVSRKKNTAWVVAFIITLLVAGGLAYALINSQVKTADEKIPETKIENPKPLVALGQYKVKAQRAYFYNDANEATRRNGYMVPSNEVITAYDDQNNFVYTEFTNPKGQTSKGWLKKTDLVTLDDWNKNQQAESTKPTDADIKNQLSDAASFLQNGQVKEALTIYNYLSGLNVPEAMYQYGLLALQGKNADLSCDDAIALVKKASDAGHLSAKRTLGYLYMFAGNKAVLQMNGYTQCEFDKNFSKARTFLTEAAKKGDTLAKQLLDELNLNEPDKVPQ